MFWGNMKGQGLSREGGCWGLCFPSGDIPFNQMLCPQHGRSLALPHFQQLWSHLLKWQVRWGVGRATSSWGTGTFTNRGIGAPGEKGELDIPHQLGGIRLGRPCPTHSSVGTVGALNNSGMQSTDLGPALEFQLPVYSLSGSMICPLRALCLSIHSM